MRILFIICFTLTSFEFVFSQIKVRNEDLTKAGLELKTYSSGKCGLLNAKDKKEIGDQNFDKIEYMDHNIWSAKRGTELFVFNVLSKKYIHSFPISNAFVRVITPNNIEKSIVYFYVNKKMGIVDLDGKIILDTLYKTISISGNYVTFLDKGFYGLISLENQKQVFPPIYNQITVAKSYFVCNSADKGNILYDLELNEIQKGFKEHRSLNDGQYIIVKDAFKKWGVIEIAQKKIVIPFEYDDISTYGLGFPISLLKIQKDKNYGIINLKNQIIVPPNYMSIDLLREHDIFNAAGTISVFSHDNKISVYNLEGKCIYALVKNITYIENVKEAISGKLVRNKFWRVTDSTGKIGIYDLKNELTILDQEYINVQSVFNAFNIVKKDVFYGVRNWMNQPLLEEKYDTIIYVLNKPKDQVETFIVKLNGKFGVVDSIGNVLIPFKYRDIQAINGFFKVKRKSTFQILDYQGKPIIKEEFDKVGSFHVELIDNNFTLLCPVYYKGKGYLINEKGKRISDITVKFIEGYEDFGQFISQVKAMLCTKDEDSLIQISKHIFIDEYTNLYWQKSSKYRNNKKNEIGFHYEKLLQLRKELAQYEDLQFELTSPRIRIDSYSLDNNFEIYYSNIICEYLIHTEKGKYSIELWKNVNVDGIWKALHFEYYRIS